ncbi:unnamed protein product [Trichobilharzia szidati]|nr:unnamed protein product [Trichobilharzia szidati]
MLTSSLKASAQHKDELWLKVVHAFRGRSESEDDRGGIAALIRQQYHRQSKDGIVNKQVSKKSKLTEQSIRNDGLHHHQQQPSTDFTDLSSTTAITPNGLWEETQENHCLLKLDSEIYKNSHYGDTERSKQVDNQDEEVEEEEGIISTSVTITNEGNLYTSSHLEENAYKSTSETRAPLNPDLEEWIKSSWIQDSGQKDSESCTITESPYNIEDQQVNIEHSSSSSIRQDSTTSSGRLPSSNRPYNHQGRRSSKPPAPPPPPSFKQSFSTATSEGDNLF